MAYLFSKDNISQSLRLGFAGGWAKAFPELSGPLKMIEASCPSLIRSFVPHSERYIMDANDDDDDTGGIKVQEDDEHTQVHITLKGYKITQRVANILQVKKDLILSTMPSTSLFSQLLRQAFEQDYGIRNIIQFSRQDKIQWYQRVASSVSNSEKRQTFKIHEFCRLGKRICQIIQFTVVTFQGKRFLFFDSFSLIPFL
jgi:hypothetical protein